MKTEILCNGQEVGRHGGVEETMAPGKSASAFSAQRKLRTNEEARQEQRRILD